MWHCAKCWGCGKLKDRMIDPEYAMEVFLKETQLGLEGRKGVF